jgi:hypothetical protein
MERHLKLAETAQVSEQAMAKDGTKRTIVKKKSARKQAVGD